MDNSNLSLLELLDNVGINKSILAKLMDVSRSTIMRMGDEVSDDVLAVIDKYKADMTSEQSESVPVAVSDGRPVIDVDQVMDDIEDIEHDQLPPAPVLPATHENIAQSRIWYGREGMLIDEVARQFGLSVFKYNQAVQDTVIHCLDNNTSFKELRG